jgi:hypothetical protein
VKSVGAVKHKLNQVRFRHMKKRIEAELRQAPGNCVYNAAMPAHAVPKSNGTNGVDVAPHRGLSLCLHGAADPVTWKPTFCDERVDGGTRAKSCPVFCSRRTKEQVKDEFKRDLEGLNIAEVAYRYPDMAALIWVLDEDDVFGAEDVPDPEEEPMISVAPPVNPFVETEPPQLPAEVLRPWWAKWLGR